MKIKTVLFLGLCYILAASAQRGGRQGYVCYTPDNYQGLCVTLPNCPSLVQLFGASRGSQNVVNYLIGVQRSCGTTSINRDPIVCCAEAYQRASQTTQSPIVRPIQTTNLPLFPPTNPPVPQTEGPIERPIRTTSIPIFPPTDTTVRTTTPSTTYLPPVSERQRSLSCFGPDGKEGVCKNLKECPVLLDRLQNSLSNRTFAQFLRQSNEICEQPTPIVCCPDDEFHTDNEFSSTESISPSNEAAITNRLLTPEEGCGYSNKSHKKIVGGDTAALGTWPWIALLGYIDEFGKLDFKCGGTLITQKHILTAAHCIRRDLSLVRLGEHDLSTTTETKHLDVPVDRVVQYPKYSRRDGHSDVAILYLKNVVPITNLIRPICLAILDELKDENYIGYNPFVAGWGKTQEGGKSATILQELQVPVLENSVCEQLYAKQSKWISQQQFDKAVICAGELSGGKDSCQGDSGGPLMFPKFYNGKFHYLCIGVVSYGIGCARPDIPGVYANVSNFLDWIKERVAEG